MTDSPPDPLSDIVVTTLTQYEAHDLRRNLLHAIRNPGLEYDETDTETEEFYKKKVAQLDEYLLTFPEKI